MQTSPGFHSKDKPLPTIPLLLPPTFLNQNNRNRDLSSSISTQIAEMSYYQSSLSIMEHFHPYPTPISLSPHNKGNLRLAARSHRIPVFPASHSPRRQMDSAS